MTQNPDDRKDPDCDELETAEALLRQCWTIMRPRQLFLGQRQEGEDGQAGWESGEAWNDLVRLIALTLRRTAASEVIDCAAGAATASAQDPIRVLTARLWKIVNDSEESLTSAVAAFLKARRRLYTAMESERGEGTSANEIARQVAEALSRPPVLAYFNARDLAAVARQVLETAHLAAAFDVAGPTPEQPRAKQVTLTLKLPLTQVTDDPAELFFHLSLQLSYAGASLAPPAKAEIPDPASLGLAEDSTPVTLLLAAGQPVLVTIGRPAHIGIPRMGKNFEPIAKTYGLHTGIPIVSSTSLQIAPDEHQGNAVASWDLPRGESR